MPEEIDDIEELIKKMQAYNPRIITIDGVGGSGKTTLAHDISQRLGQEKKVTVISLDLFLRSGSGRALFKIGILRNVLKEQLKLNQDDKIIIVEGVFLRQVMEKLRRATNNRVGDQQVYHIYCVIKNPVRGNFDSFYEAKDISSLYEETVPPTPWWIQLFHYHQRFNPCERADIIYIRTQEDLSSNLI